MVAITCDGHDSVAAAPTEEISSDRQVVANNFIEGDRYVVYSAHARWPSAISFFTVVVMCVA